MCAMLLVSNLSMSVWGYAIQHVNYIKNHMHTDRPPFEKVYQKKPILHDTYDWGKNVYMRTK